eukprot:scaffold111638_cov33-Tisochrysis_lutea.AAC.4
MGGEKRSSDARSSESMTPERVRVDVSSPRIPSHSGSMPPYGISDAYNEHGDPSDWMLSAERARRIASPLLNRL